MPLPSQARLRAILDYYPDTGIFVWKRRGDRSPHWNGRYAGAVAGATDKDGYRVIHIDDHSYKAHRLAWVMVHGDGLRPEQEVDHKDGVPGHDWIANLRIASLAQNQRNMRGHRDAALPKGVYQVSRCARFYARICVDRRTTYLGSFATVEDAHAAYVASAQTLHGEFARGE